MDKNIFIEKLFDLLREKLGEEVTITQRTIEKSNGISYEGFTIEKKTEYISPVVSIDNCYDDYSSGISLDEIIGNEFQIPLESDIRKDVSEMCNLSQGIEDRAFERGTANGISIGKKEGLAEVVLKLIKKGVSIEQVSDMLDMDIKDVQDIIENK